MLKPTWNPFSAYADKFERRIERLLRKAGRLGIFEIQRLVTELMQENLVIFSLYMEARFKGYKYLKTGARKKMYKNAERIGQLFLRYTHGITVKDEAVAGILKELKVLRPSAPGDAERLRYLVAIMIFLRPNGEYYRYLEGASFGKLLKNIEKGEKMTGDCNQIVTFYTYLYSLRYDIKELQIKILPGHVCLHYKGVDIEATAGNFANYEKFDRLLPIAELISTNLLDISDFRDKQIQVNAREFLKGAQLASNLSSEREIVAKNLKAAYHNVGLDVLRNNDFENAREFFRKAGDSEMIKATYGKEYNLVQARVAGLKDLALMKTHRSDYQKMLDLARKMEDSTLADNLRKILNQL